MSVKYIPVQWNPNKWFYDGVMLSAVIAFLWVFINVVPDQVDHSQRVDRQIQLMRAFGACAFMMLTVILAIGPLARLSTRFLPLLYNRRHFGVMTLFVALTHASYVLDWYFAFSPTPKLEGLLSTNTDFGQVAGFPFAIFGIFSLLALMLLAFTSHDFWMKFLTPPLWKKMHYAIYAAYASAVAHVALGIFQDQRDHTLSWIILGSAGLVCALHLWAALSDQRTGDPTAPPDSEGFFRVCSVREIDEGRARIARLPSGDRVAVFRNGGTLSAISNACAHQNGPLGEGRIVDCLVTCPWHGFQYRVTDGQSPAPFTEKVPTFNLRLQGSSILVDPAANPPGTYVEPLTIPEALQ